MDLARSRAHAGLLFGAAHLTQTPLLLRERGLDRGVSVVLLEAGGAELLGGRGKEGIAEVLAAQLAHEGEARRGEQHLLAHWGSVGHVRHGHQGRAGRVAPEDDIQGLIGLDVWPEEGFDIGCKRGARRRRGQQLEGLQLFGRDGREEAKMAVRPEEVVELGDQLLRRCGRLAIPRYRSTERRDDAHLRFPTASWFRCCVWMMRREQGTRHKHTTSGTIAIEAPRRGGVAGPPSASGSNPCLCP